MKKMMKKTNNAHIFPNEHRISAEREMTLKFDEVEELCKLSSIEEVPMDEEREVTDSKYPEWISGTTTIIYSSIIKTSCHNA